MYCTESAVQAHIGDGVAPNRCVSFVDIDLVLVAVAALTTILGLAAALIFLPLHVRLIAPALWRLDCLFLLFLILTFADLQHADQTRIDYMPAVGRRPGLLNGGAERWNSGRRSCT